MYMYIPCNVSYKNLLSIAASRNYVVFTAGVRVNIANRVHDTCAMSGSAGLACVAVISFPIAWEAKRGEKKREQLLFPVFAFTLSRASHALRKEMTATQATAGYVYLL